MAIVRRGAALYNEMMMIDDREFWMIVREALLLFIDAIERKWCITPRTSVLRKFKNDV